LEAQRIVGRCASAAKALEHGRDGGNMFGGQATCDCPYAGGENVCVAHRAEETGEALEAGANLRCPRWFE
jgi:hypothetical protein